MVSLSHQAGCCRAAYWATPMHDGAMRVDGNGGSKPNYFPNSFDNIHTDEVYRQKAENLGQHVVADWYDRNGAGENDYYTQTGYLFVNDR